MISFVKFGTILLLAALILFSSCSTIIQGSKQNITIRSLTPGAKIYVDGDVLGNDSVTTRVKRNRTHTVIIMKEGYETRQVFLEGNVQPGYVIADIALCFIGIGLVSIIVDAVTDSWTRLEPDKVVFELEKK